MKYSGNNSPEYWDKSWEQGIKKFPLYTMNMIKRLIPVEVSVLDIGSGDGTFLKRLKEEKKCSVYGIDISVVAIEKAKELGIPGEVRSAEELDDFDMAFDVVVCSHLLEHIGNDEGLIANIFRITKNFAVITVPNDCSYPEETGEHVKKYTKESLKTLLNKYFSKIEDYTRYNRELLKNHLIFKCLK